MFADADTYQGYAARTINLELDNGQVVQHALHLLSAEVGELHAIWQKQLQHHSYINKNLVVEEAGDCLWAIAELLTGLDISMASVMEANIDKLKARYPDGFSEERSRNR